MSLVYSCPEVTREQIILVSHHQFKEGDVQHWWHPPSGRGVRTRISDDLLWLPFVASFYIGSDRDAICARRSCSLPRSTASVTRRTRPVHGADGFR